MRCMWCGVKYSDEFEDVSCGFCSDACQKNWEKYFE